jgi:hypothetical protein
VPGTEVNEVLDSCTHLQDPQRIKLQKEIPVPSAQNLSTVIVNTGQENCDPLNSRKNCSSPLLERFTNISELNEAISKSSKEFETLQRFVAQFIFVSNINQPCIVSNLRCDGCCVVVGDPRE